MACFVTWVVCPAQKILALDIYRPFNVKRVRFSVDDKLVYKLKGERHLYRDTIAGMNDSALVFMNGANVALRDIKMIRVSRHMLIRLAGKFGIRFGILFMSLDAFNNLINHESPVFKERALIIGGSAVVAGALLRLMENRRVHIGPNRRLHVIDFGG